MPSNYVSTEFSIPLRGGLETASVHEVAVGDFTGDGKLDVVLSYFLYPLEDRGVPIRALVGDGAGGFADQTSALFVNAPTTVHARETVAADFNRDGRLDLFIADHGYDAAPFPGAQNALILSSGATGVTNATSQLPQLSDYTHSAEGADIDGDGDTDIFIGNGGGGTAYVKPYFLINNGVGGFTKSDAGLPASALNGANHWSEAFIDADGDGDKDLFLGSSLNTGSTLLLNNGQGVFTDSGKTLPRGVSTADAVDIQVIDVNNDGRSDLVLSYSNPANGGIQRQLQVLINDGQGGFADETAARLPASVLSGEWVRRLQVADVNGDGLQDLVLSNNSTTPVLLNDGFGHFIATPNMLPGNQYDLLTPADVNGDGHLDFVAWRGTWDGKDQLRVDLWRDAGPTQTGTAGADTLLGDADSETLSGGAGDDVILGGAGLDYIRGDEGDDVLIGGGAFDDINGNMGNDTAHGGDGDDWVVGGRDDDLLYGDSGFDVVYGNLGNDTVYGGDGADWVRGGQGADIVDGGAGDDWLAGDRGADTVTGGAGADKFYFFSGAGIDRITDFSSAQGDRVLLDAGQTYTLSYTADGAVIDLGAGDQMILVGATASSIGDWLAI
jgi:Ca2+-binding RTX toxin-like protein